MKKILAMVMAIVMMMAIAVPAFAAVVDKDTTKETDGSQLGQATVATTFDTDDISYSIEIPATINIAWNSLLTDENYAKNNAGYTVDSSLATGDTLAITVSKVDDGKMYLEDDTAKEGDFLTFNIDGDLAEKTFSGYNDGTAGPELTAHVTDWSGVSMDAYLGYITYTVVYTAA